jgi:hypothetical protein
MEPCHLASGPTRRRYSKAHFVNVYYKKVLLPQEVLPSPKRVESISEDPSIVENQHHQQLYFVQPCLT